MKIHHSLEGMVFGIIWNLPLVLSSFLWLVLVNNVVVASDCLGTWRAGHVLDILSGVVLVG